MEDIFGNEFCDNCSSLGYTNLAYKLVSHPRSDWLTPEDFRDEILSALKRGCIHIVKRLVVKEHEYLYGEMWSPKAYALKFYKNAIKENSLEALEHFHKVFNLPVFFVVGHFALGKKYSDFNRKAPLYLAIETGRVQFVEWICKTFHPEPEYLKNAFLRAIKSRNLDLVKFLHEWIEDESINSVDDAFVFTRWFVFWQHVYRKAIDWCFKNGGDEKVLEIFKYLDDVVSFESRGFHCVCEYAESIITRKGFMTSEVDTGNLIWKFWVEEEAGQSKMKKALKM